MSKDFKLSQDLLDRCHERAPGYDLDNRFFQEDFDELKKAGYLLMTVPEEFGGYGMKLAEVASVLICGGPVTSHCSGYARRQARARSSPPDMLSRAMTCRCSCPRPRPSP